MLEDLAKARDYYHQCLEVARNIEKDHYFASIALNNIGEGLTDEGDYLGAHRYYLEAYEIDQRRGDRHGVAVMLANLGNNALAREIGLRLVVTWKRVFRFSVILIWKRRWGWR